MATGLGEALRKLRAGALKDAEVLCHAALADEAQRSDALHILGLVAHRRGEGEAALAFMRRAVDLDPRNGSRRIDLAQLAYEVGAYYHAVAHLEVVIAGCGEVAEALHCLGISLLALNQPQMAIDRLERAVVAARGFSQAWADLGRAYLAAGRPDAAVAAIEGALKQEPGNAGFAQWLARAHLQARRPDRAQAILELLVAQEPETASHWLYLGHAQTAQGHWKAALAAFRSAVDIAPDLTEHQLALAEAQLLLGNFANAWEHFRSAARNPGATAEQAWDGLPVTDSAVYLRAGATTAQTLMLCRFAALVLPLAPKVVLSCQAELRELLQNSLPSITVADSSSESPPADAACAPLIALPSLLRLGAELHGALPYLHADPAHVAYYRQEIESGCTLHVGLCWQGALGPGEQQHSMHLSKMLPLLDLSDVRVISLQQGEAAKHAAALPRGYELQRVDFLENAAAADYAQLAALITALDLVVTVDSDVAHLAGAMGKPVWIVLANVPRAHWGLSDRPWYPNARFFRQRKRNDFSRTIAEVRAALCEFGRAASAEPDNPTSSP